METAATQEVDVNKKAKVLVRLGLYYELIRRDLILSDFRYGSNPPTAKGRGGGGRRHGTCCMFGLKSGVGEEGLWPEV